MNKKRSIQIKAAFLLIVFSFNTILGVACSVGYDFRFNSKKQEITVQDPTVHIHADGKKHQHTKAPVSTVAHVHSNGNAHHHGPEPIKSPVHAHPEGSKHAHPSEAVKQRPGHDVPVDGEEEDCCNDELAKFQLLDKRVSQAGKIAIEGPVTDAIPPAFNTIEQNCIITVPQLSRPRFFYPPPPDILIAIQRFQI